MLNGRLPLTYESIKCFIYATCLTKNSIIFENRSLANICKHSLYTYTGQVRILEHVIDKMLLISGGDLLQQPIATYWNMGTKYRRGELLLPLDVIKRFLQIACIERIIEACRISNIKIYMIVNGKMELEALSTVTINKIAQYILDVYQGKYKHWEYNPRKRNGKLTKAQQAKAFFEANKVLGVIPRNIHNMKTRLSRVCRL